MTSVFIIAAAEPMGETGSRRIEEMQAILLNLFFHHGEAHPGVYGPTHDDPNNQTPKKIYTLKTLSEAHVTGQFLVQGFHFLLDLSEGTVTSVSSRMYRSDMFRIKRLWYEYLPSTVRFLAIERCGQQFELKTRLLPKMATNVSLHSNKIFGSIDLWTLPEDLVYFDVSHNAITGTIDLCELPRAIESINLGRNFIEQEALEYANLPQTLKVVSLEDLQISAIFPAEGQPSSKVFVAPSKTRVS